MSLRWFIGVGCRKGASAVAIASLVADTCGAESPPDAELFTLDIKRNEPGLNEAARRLGCSLTFLTAEQLRAVPETLFRGSAVVERAVGVPSVAEAAALAGAGPGSHLLHSRRSRDGVTCAVAVREKAGS